MSPRWSDYFMTRDFSGFWAARLREDGATVCVITGIGFDPRCRTVLDQLAGLAPAGRTAVLGLRFQTALDAIYPVQLLNEYAQTNLRAIAANGSRQIAIGEVRLQDENRFPAGGPGALRFVAQHMGSLQEFRHIVVDISGMPRSVFYPLISYLCDRADRGLVANLHIAISEDVQLDRKILLSEFGNADYIHTFRLTDKKKLIWLPIIGSGERDRIVKIHDQIKDDCIEICPVLPFPSDPLRKPDDVLIANSEVLFQELAITHTNLLLCDETNPFDIYRKVVALHDYYSDKLSPLVGSVTTVVSPLSSKLLSLGALFAAIERKLPVSYVEAGLYNLEDGAMEVFETAQITPIEIWLAGEPYRMATA
jgi:hypothetical protein